MDFLIFSIVVLALNFIPFWVALARGHQHCLPIFLTTLFLGWTGIGWIAALIWSVMPVTARPDTVESFTAKPVVHPYNFNSNRIDGR